MQGEEREDRGRMKSGGREREEREGSYREVRKGRGAGGGEGSDLSEEGEEGRERAAPGGGTTVGEELSREQEEVGEGRGCRPRVQPPGVFRAGRLRKEYTE